MKYVVFLTVTLLPLLCNLANGSISVRWYVTDQSCKRYQGYAPGGSEPNIKPIMSPEATFDTKAVLAVAKVTKFIDTPSQIILPVAGIVDTLLNDDEMIRLTKVAMKFAKGFKSIAPFLGPTFGIISTLLGNVPGVKPPDAQDALNAVNKGFKQLTNDINKRLDNMKQYVDFTVLQLDKKLMNNDFKELYTYWTGCLTEMRKEDVNRCQRNAARKFNSKLSSFMRFESQFEGKKELKLPKNVKELEMSLLVFTQYVTVHLLCLQTLMNTYGTDKSLYAAQEHFSYFRGKYDKVALKSSNYVSWAVKQIIKAHNCNGISPYLYVKKVLDTGGAKAYDITKKKWSGVVTKRVYSIQKLQCDPLNLESVCSAKGWTYRSRCYNHDSGNYLKCHPGSIVSVITEVSGVWSAAGVVGNKAAKKQCLEYLKQTCKDITTFWENEIEKTSNIWRKLGKSQ